jgi:hypothetical protein
VASVSTFESSFVPGQQFPPQIIEHIERSHVVLAVIGPGWRLGGPADWVRSELAAAHDRRIPVLPVLFDDADMPSEADLPGLEWLATANAIELRTAPEQFFAADTQRVVVAARKLRRRSDRGWLVAAVAALVLVVALAVGLVVLLRDGDDPPETDSRLDGGDRLTSGQSIQTADERHELEMTAEGVLLASTDGAEFWRSDGPPVAGALAILQEDGNLVIYPSPDEISAADALWSSGTCCHVGAHLEIGDQGGDGFVAIYTVDGAELFRVPDGVDVTIPPTDPSTASTVAPVAIPIVAGRTEADARQVLEDAGFAVESVAEASSTVDAGIVIRTEPEGGTTVEPQSAVRLVVSSGEESVTVPDVVGETEAAARRALGALDVTVTYQDLPVGDPSDGLVIRQSVRAGTNVAAGSPIRLTIGRAAVID